MRVSALIHWLARVLAILGGVVLVAITAMTVASILGRALIPIGLSPVPGDFELVEAGIGFAVFAFLPWCQLNRGHATVDLFTSFLPASPNRWIDLISEFLMTVAVIIIAWRLWIGMTDKIRYQETTFILQFPVWWSFAACMAAAAVGVIVSVYMLLVRVKEVRTGRAVFAPPQGVIH